MQSKTWLAMVVSVVLSACASTGGSHCSAHAAAPASATGMMAEMCPMGVTGTTVAASDVEGGAALSFTGGADVAELQRRVHHMAEMHNHHAEGGGMMGMHGGCAGHDASAAQPGGMAMMPAATATAEDVAGGARMVLRPTDAAQLDALRVQVRAHAARMAGGCPMMNHGAPAATPPTT